MYLRYCPLRDTAATDRPTGTHMISFVSIYSVKDAGADHVPAGYPFIYVRQLYTGAGEAA